MSDTAAEEDPRGDPSDVFSDKEDDDSPVEDQTAVEKYQALTRRPFVP